MKKIKYILPVLLFFICINVKAIDACTNEEMARLRELANNVQFKTDYKVNPIETTNEIGERTTVDAEVLFNIQLINDNEDLKYYYKLPSWSDKEKVSASELLNEEFYDGETIQIYIYSYTINLCTNELLKTETIKLPVYNRYYYLNQDKCKENPEFKYCKEFMDIGELTFEDIDKQYDEYATQKTVNNISSIIKDNIYYIVGGIIAIIFIVFIIIFLKKRKKKLDI